MASTTIGTIQLLATIDTSQYKKGASEIERANSGIEGSAGSTSKKANSAFTSIGKIGLATVAAAAIAAGAVIVKNIGGAVKRVDTLNNFPKIMANLGYGAEASTKAIKKLDMGVRGLPTSLDGIASAMQNIAPSTKSLSYATDLTLALNNALVAGGKTADLQASAMEQFSQAVAKGKPDMMEWRSLATAMPGQLKQISNSLGFSNWQKMAAAVKDGDISFQDVQDTFIKLNKKGLGEFPSLADQAKNASGGLQTSIANMNIGITRGIGNVITAIGTDDIANALSGIGKAFEKALSSSGGFINFIKKNKNFIAPIVIAVGAMVTAITAWYAITLVMTAAQAILNATLLANPIGLIIVAVVGLVAAFLYLWNNVEGFRNFFTKAWDIIKNAFNVAVTFIKKNWQLLLAILLGPFGVVVGLIIKNFDKIKGAAMAVFNWVKSNWKLLLAIITGPIGLAVYAVIRNFNKIKSAVGGVINWIKSAFSGLASKIGGFFSGIWRGIGSSLKSIINTILHLPLKLPTIKAGGKTLVGGQTLIPALAKGGIVTSATLAMVGEGREPEAVIPLSKLDSMINGSGTGGGGSVIKQYNTVNNNVDMNVVNRKLAWELNRA